MLKKIRVLLASLCFAGLCLLFLDSSSILPQRLAFLGKLQLVPAILSGSVALVAVLLVLTLAAGRIYCSVLCPLGVLQDVLAHYGRKGRYRYSRGKTLLRFAAVVVFVVSFSAGLSIVWTILEPYSAFGRIATDILSPVWQEGGNALALASERAGNFLVAPTPVWQKGLSALLAAILTLAALGALAWKHGRTWCNTICPVGAGLGLFSRFAVFRPRINHDRCTHCGLCAKNCKASCIDATNGVIDSSRCVDCFNCLDACRFKALAYAPAWGRSPSRPQEKSPPNQSRRALLAAALTIAAPALAQARDRKTIAALTRKERPMRSVPITPPGSTGLKAFSSRCTGCQLCVSSCPNQVLSAFDHGQDMLQPTLSFERGFCRVECVNCSTVCPTGAIRPITVAEKSATQIGRAYVRPELCIVNTDKVSCTACSRNCPPGAITLVGEGKLKMPVVDNEHCTGCGACEYICPARPAAAIWVDGNREHRRI